MSSISPKNILIVKNRAIGDSVMGLATVSYIRDLFPEAKLYYAIPSWIVPLYQDVKIDADEVVGLDLKGLRGWWRLRKFLTLNDIDLVFEMHLSGRTFKFFNLFSKVYKIPYYFHNHHLKSGGPVKDQGEYKALTQRDLDGAWSHLSKKGDPPLYLNYTPRIGIKTEKKEQVVLGIVATRETKKWDLNYYHKLCLEIVKLNPLLKILIPLSSSEEDRKAEQALSQKGLPSQVEFLRVTLDKLPLHLAGSLLYVGNDTGLKHICVALGVKTFTFFGPEPPKEWHPYSEVEHPYFYIDNLECRTVKAHYCGLFVCESMICLKKIGPDEVLKKITPELL